ncbi:MAG TPA: sigma-54 dependent transcriptional regulator [Spirochaetota bacterium]|nr:sigma-54 dependent transcriptional regulator [Spirochaetota bacterium]HOS32705.1 sigma-54 dependent transcriptional regulator [Spirochaetota bacterium]HOS55853.1 sigma-54 dependent transcriptional regulator [Spirochaetota bacterium]HPK61850.1 sigma-54 dependent transcriptional regulator [Spirochaetota bacterium]HQF78436.1 sigma-54 dependent transcriptional regulator [Spirochaetota bacterium]
MEDNFIVIGKSSKLKSVFDIVERVSKTPATVLITGESGTGKELVANIIHKKSDRKDQPFVAINCASIPETLLENELFGHKKGAFTDATSDYIGKIGAAHNGFLFLDEIGEMPLSVQPKLLRFLQYKSYEPLGSNDSIFADVRIIAATNRDLTSMVNRGKFREDLYYRLNVIPITLPPLRERREDIIDIANHFISAYNKKYDRNILGISDEAKDMMLNYEWRGNVRELQNVIEKAVILSSNRLLRTEDIKIDSKQLANSYPSNLKDAIQKFKKEFIISALEKNRWNQTKTAAVLQIQRTYLTRLVKELNIDKY